MAPCPAGHSVRQRWRHRGLRQGDRFIHRSMTWVVARGERSVTVVALSSRCLCRLRRGTPRCSAGCRRRRLTRLPGDVESACARSARNQEAQAGSCCCGWRKGALRSAGSRRTAGEQRLAAESPRGGQGSFAVLGPGALQTMSCVWRVACGACGAQRVAGATDRRQGTG